MTADVAITELTDDHVPAVVTLCERALDLPEDAAEAGPIVHRLREPARGPGRVARQPVGGGPNPRRVVGFVATAASGGPVVAAVLGSISHRDPALGHIDLIAVEPPLRRRGIGRRLVSVVEDALAGLGAGTVLFAGNPPYYAWPGIDVRYTPAVCLATGLGYAPDQPAWNMTADLSSPGSPALRPTAPDEQRLAGAGITVRRAVPDDVPVLVDFATAHFTADWAGEIADSIGRDRAGCHLATGADGAVLGFAAYGSSRPSWFGPMGTAGSARGLGVGAVLLRRCLADQRAAGHDRVQIGWVGPVPFYSNAAGARTERVFFRYRKRLEAPPEA